MDASSIWNLVTILGGITLGIVLISFISRWTGIGEFLGNVLSIVSTFFQSVFSALQSMVQAAPRPIRIVIFALLFVFIGSIIYNNTIGLTHVCYEGNVYSTDFFNGMALMLIPSDINNSLYIPFDNLPSNIDAGGPIQTDSSGNPSFVVPDQYAPVTDSKLINVDKSDPGIGDQNVFFDFGLSYHVCVTKNKACYLSDVNHGIGDDCTIKDDDDKILAKGTLVFEVRIEFDKKYINTDTGGLKYVIVGMPYNFYSFVLYFMSLGGHMQVPASVAFNLDNCVSGDSDYPWLVANSSKYNDYKLNATNTRKLQPTGTFMGMIDNIFTTTGDFDYGTASVMYNAIQINVIKKEVETEAPWLSDGNDYNTVVIARALADTNDPYYAIMASKMNTEGNFISMGIEDGTFIKLNNSDDDIISFRCSADSTQEELLLLGFPIMDKTFVMVALLLIVVISAIATFRKY